MWSLSMVLIPHSSVCLSPLLLPPPIPLPNDALPLLFPVNTALTHECGLINQAVSHLGTHGAIHGVVGGFSRSEQSLVSGCIY